MSGGVPFAGGASFFLGTGTGLFLPHGWNLHILLLLHWQVDSLPLSHPRSPNIDCSLNKSINVKFPEYDNCIVLMYDNKNLALRNTH